MAEELVQNIIQALTLAHQKRRDRLALEQKSQEDLAQRDKEQQRIDLEHERLDQAKKQFDVTQKAASAMHDLQIQKTKQEIAAGIQPGQTGPGETGITTNKDANGDETETHNIPGVGMVTIPTQAAALKKHIAVLDATTGPDSPAAKAKIAETEASKTQDFQKMIAEHSFINDRAKEHEAAENLRNQLTRQTQLQVGAGHDAARLAASKNKTAAEAVDTTPFVERLANGTATMEDLKTELGPKTSLTAFGQAAGQGIVPLKNVQKDALQNLNQLTPVLPMIDEYNQILKANPIAARTPFTAEYKRLTTLEGQIQTLQPNIGRVVEGLKGRMSNQQIQYAKEGFMPNRGVVGSSVQSNVERYQNLEKTLHQAADNILSSQPIGQRGLIKQQLGLLPPPAAQGQQGQPQQQVGLPAPNTPQAPQQPQQIHYQRDPATGKLVMVQQAGGQ